MIVVECAVQRQGIAWRDGPLAARQLDHLQAQRLQVGVSKQGEVPRVLDGPQASDLVLVEAQEALELFESILDFDAFARLLAAEVRSRGTVGIGKGIVLWTSQGYSTDLQNGGGDSQ